MHILQGGEAEPDTWHTPDDPLHSYGLAAASTGPVLVYIRSSDVDTRGKPLLAARMAGTVAGAAWRPLMAKSTEMADVMQCVSHFNREVAVTRHIE